MAIPKIIHQTYKTQTLPVEIYPIVEQLKNNNPDWEYRFYSDDDALNYIQKNFDKQILDAYLRLNPVYGAAKADLFRYLVLYQEGGVYVDIKSTCIHALNDIIRDDDRFIVTQWQNDIGQQDEGTGLFLCLTQELNIKYGEYQQWFIVCEKHSPVMKHIIKTVVNNILHYRPWFYGFHSYGKRGVLFVTGPIAYTKAIHEIEQDYPIRFERYDKDLGFVYNALPNNQSHTKVLNNHYANYKGHIVNQGAILNIIFAIYILGVRLIKNTLKSIGKWQE